MNQALGPGTRALVVFNPKAGQAGSLEHALHAAQDVWQSHGWQVELRPTAAAGDATRIAREAADAGYDVVVAAGGDGTVNEVINGLAGTSTALAALPIGTVNVWVREIGLPMNPRAAAEAYLQARVEQIDLGRAGDRYFLLMAGIGFDAAVTAEVDSETKKRLGVLAYAWRAVSLGLRFKGMRVSLTLDGKRENARVLMVVLGNSQLYGGFVKMTAHASINDGLLDVCVIRGQSLWSAPSRLLSIFMRRHNLDPYVEYHRVRNIRIESQYPIPVQVDGDYIGETPLVFEAVPGALRALLPPMLPPDLLRDEPEAPRRAWQRIVSVAGRRNTSNHTKTTDTPAQSEQTTLLKH